MKIVDLFSGAGGLTFGFTYSLLNGHFIEKEANEIIFANECDSNAAASFRTNFPKIPLIEKKIEDLSEEEIKKHVGDNDIDLIIGGPPCQSFTTIGKRRYDDKAKLYEEYFRLLKIIKPKIFLFENVTGILTMKDEYGNSVIDTIKSRFENIDENLGYNVSDKVLDAVDYGVPQHRERVFIVGVRNDLKVEWKFPETPQKKKITLIEAISDLPPLQSGRAITQYTSEPTNMYQRIMRNNATQLTHHHATAHGEKIQTVIKNVKQGEGREDFNNLVDAGLLPEEYRLTSGYHNTYGRLVANKPCTTITHNMSTPSGLRCIHYCQNRALTPREGARIQSFPDWFQFHGNRSDVKTQIGNAVPPLLAMALENEMTDILDRGTHATNTR